MIFDVDGVFTQSNILLTDSDFLRSVNTQDGYAVKKALKAGINVAIMTKGQSPLIKKRFNILGVEHVYLIKGHKKPIFEEFSALIGPSMVASYMGDDISDIAVMNSVYLPCCPYDAVPEVQQAAKYISPVKGGKTCVRDLIQRVLSSQSKW